MFRRATNIYDLGLGDTLLGTFSPRFFLFAKVLFGWQHFAAAMVIFVDSRKKRSNIMRRLLVLIAAAGTSFGVAAEAGNHKSGQGHSGGAYKVTNCPPDLAKKNPPCVPPGQARKYNRGDVIYGDYTIIGDPRQYGLNRDQTYYRVGEYVYRVDRDTREVLDLIGAVARVLD